jgi:hypothetical protein
MAWDVKEMTEGGGGAAHAGVWWGDLMTAVGHASVQGCLEFRKSMQRMNFRWE